MGTSGTKACVTADLSFSVDAGKEIQMEALKGQKYRYVDWETRPEDSVSAVAWHVKVVFGL